MKSNYPIIDGHGHMLPSPNQIPQSIKDLGYFNIEGPKGQQMMTQNFIKWTRPVQHPSFFPKPRLEWMQKHNIAHTMVLTLSQLYCNRLPKRPTLDIIKFQNEFQLELQETNPDKFSCGFVVQPRWLKESLKEIEKRVNEGLKFLCLPTHYFDKNRRFTSCTDEVCQEVFAMANSLGLPVQIHPYDQNEIIGLKDGDSYWAGHVVGMQYLSAHFFYQFTCKALHLKYPKVRFYLSHGNILSMATMGRKVQAFQGRPDLFPEIKDSPAYALNAQNVFCDTITHDWDAIWLIKQKLGTDRLIHGIDSPYPLGDGVDYVNPKVYPGFTLDNAEDQLYITPDEKRKILRDNALYWLYGNDSQKIQNFTNMIYS